MSTTKRLRRHARASSRYLTDAQYAKLTSGLTIPGAGFASEEQEQAAWKLHRNDLMREEESGPGRRPHAFFKFDLGEIAPRWFDQIKLLMDHKLIDSSEALLIEREFGSLGPNRTAGALQRIRSGPGPMGSERYAREFAITAAWHCWRGRPEEAERWTELAAIARGGN